MSTLNTSKLDQFVRGPVLHDTEADRDHRFPFLVGVELELENVNIKDGPARPVGWEVHVDESLRNGTEYVFRSPVSGNKVEQLINNFYKLEYTYKNSPRTSTHIHVNMCGATVENLRAMFIVSYSLEEAVFRSLESSRKHCGYCMPLSEMHNRRISRILGTEDVVDMSQAMGGNNAEKYYGFNINSVRKHGTVEFRYFPGGPSKEDLLSWIDLCVGVKKLGISTSLDELRSIDSPAQYYRIIRKNLGTWADKLVDAVGLDYMFAAFQEVMALLPTGDVERVEPLVSAHPYVVNLLSKNYFSMDVQREAFKDRVNKLGVMSFGDWEAAVAYASRQRPDAKASAAPLAVRGVAEHVRGVVHEELALPTVRRNDPRRVQWMQLDHNNPVFDRYEQEMVNRLNQYHRIAEAALAVPEPECAPLNRDNEETW